MAFNFQQLSDDPNTLFLSCFIPFPKLSSASAFQPGSTQPVTEDSGAPGPEHMPRGALFIGSLCSRAPCWVGWGFLRSASRSYGSSHTCLLPLLFIFFQVPPLTPQPTPHQKKPLCPPTSVSAWVSQRAQLMQVKNQL